MKTTKTDYKKWWSISRRKELALWIGVLLLGLVSVRSPSQTYTILHAFGTNTIGHNPYSTLVQGPDGMLYGTTDSGGVANRGQVFKVNPDGSGYTVLKDFTGSDGSGPDAGLVLSGTALYGTTSSGGTNDNGTVFKVNTDGTGFAVLKQFTGYDGANPYAKLMLSGAMLYGITAYGGYSDAGTVFKINTDGSSFANLYSFTARDPDTGTNNDGANPVAELILSGDILYGTTECGGCYGCGTVFAVNTDGSSFTNLYSFTAYDPDTGTNNDGANPVAGLILSGDVLYGTTEYGGNYGYGTVFTINTNGCGFAVLRNFTGSDGAHPAAGLVLSGAKLYGTTCDGGYFDHGTVFAINTDGSGFTMTVSFRGHDGGYPTGNLLLSGTNLFGTTSGGGGYDYGTVFRINTDGSGYEALKDFNGSDGEWPNGGLVLSGATLYGTTSGGGTNGNGTVFAINARGNGYIVLHNFGVTPDDAAGPSGGVVLSGDTLYGTTGSGGGFGKGTVFKINTDGSGYAVLKEFDGSDGWGPQGTLVLSGTTLFGATSSSGISDTIFKINTDGSGFAVLKEFDGSDGWYPNGGLVLSGTTLYGTTAGEDFASGKYVGATVFSIDIDGSGYTLLHKFFGAPLDGASPLGGLALSGNSLYGTTVVGGCYGYDPSDFGAGTVFRVNTDGSGYYLLKQFTGDDGCWPFAGLLLDGTMLYGTTYNGGTTNCGVVFKLSLLPSVSTPPPSQTVELESSTLLGVNAGDDPTLTYLWFCNGTNLISCGADNCLLITNADFSLSGTFTVVVTNAFGAVTSAPAMLNVIPAVERRPVPGVKVMGEIGSSLNVEYTESLSPAPNWLTLDIVNLTNPPQYCVDASTTLLSQRFYRAWQMGTPSIVPSLSLTFVPAITLTGNIGDSMRLDCINQFGPTDAWMTLDTVTLTNTSQLYFDTSTVGQPARLYRIVPVP